MLKLNASYSKKVPADTEYSSQSYHASCASSSLFIVYYDCLFGLMPAV